MALILHRYYSYALTECDSMTVIIPEEKFPGKTFPVLWLLSPLGTDHTGWQRFGSAENLADEKGYIVVIPDLKLSYGQNMLYGLKYFDMLTKELPEIIQDYYPADIECQIIAGAEEGAYAALYAALNTTLYKTVILLSCGSITDETSFHGFESEAANVFGTNTPTELQGTDKDLFETLISANSQTIPQIILSYSDKDKYAASAKKLSNHLKKTGKGTVILSENPQTWTDWFLTIKNIL